MSITRKLPNKLRPIEYPNRYDQKTFDNLNEILQDSNCHTNYEILKSGKNPYTNYKIKLFGPTYNKVLKNFLVSARYYKKTDQPPMEIPFTEFREIDNQKQYMHNTLYLYKLVDTYNAANEPYNLAVDELHKQINNLRFYDEYVIFPYDNKKYGKLDYARDHLKNE